jgi:phosphoenolpyruvate carboxylase
LLAQLGKRHLLKMKAKSYDEAVSLIWYLENVFYQTSGEMVHYLQKRTFQRKFYQNPLIKLVFGLVVIGMVTCDY